MSTDYYLANCKIYEGFSGALEVKVHDNGSKRVEYFDHAVHRIPVSVIIMDDDFNINSVDCLNLNSIHLK